MGTKVDVKNIYTIVKFSDSLLRRFTLFFLHEKSL